jgi:UDP-N-acetylglucosamine--N-acetylmuramyl-(pentapeptide) pyrophosphoryl-undecaprenol N-acetylglucosamine transferase
MDEVLDSEGKPQDSVEHSFQSLKRRYSRNQRELRRLRNTVSFQLGLHLTTAVRRPWRLLILPISFPLLVIKLGMQRLGKRPVQLLEELESVAVHQRNNSIVLFPTNGVGFGHFTRMYAVARALRKSDPTLEIIFFTPMPTLHILYNEEFPTYHLAGRYKHAEMSASQWNGLVEDMLHMIFDAHRPKWFMFDGAFPYRGMLNAIASQQSMQKWWMRRGSLKSNKSIPIDSTAFFDGVIVPSEGIDKSNSPDYHFVAPIKALEPNEAWSRSFARSRLSVPDSAKVVYVQLGAGVINEIEDILQHVLDGLFSYDDVYVVLGESMLGQRLSFSHERLRVIRDYPNSLYAHAFDASVQAGGYNSYQEMRMFGVPTLFIPNTETGMDDQVARCKESEKEGWGTVYLPGEEKIEQKISELLEISADPIPSENGVHSVIKLLGIELP